MGCGLTTSQHDKTLPEHKFSLTFLATVAPVPITNVDDLFVYFRQHLLVRRYDKVPQKVVGIPPCSLGDVSVVRLIELKSVCVARATDEVENFVVGHFRVIHIRQVLEQHGFFFLG